MSSFSIIISGLLLYIMWEAMLVTYLATRFTVLPFDGIATLVKNSNFKIAVSPGTSQNDAFKLSTDPLWKEAWQQRIEPFQEGYSAIPSNFNSTSFDRTKK